MRTSVLIILLVSSIALSWWASYLSLVKLPAADVWQHVSLIEQAAVGHLSLDNLLSKHNQLHFIPVPKLVYALDLILASGSGLLTAGISALFTLVCCLCLARMIRDIDALDPSEKNWLVLLIASWLTCIIQWESFVNPANLQWSGLNAGLAMMAMGLRQRPVWLTAGALLSLGCGAPWWLLLLAYSLLMASRNTLLTGGSLLVAAALLWECINLFWLRRYAPLPMLAMAQVLPVSSDQLHSIITLYFENPVGFYLGWLKNLLLFITRFTLPPVDRWLPDNALIWLLPLPVAAYLTLVNTRQQWRGFTFLATAALLTGLAAGFVRAQMPGAYTLRFANTGLLFTSACFVLGYGLCRPASWRKYCWWTFAMLYSVLLLVFAIREAADIVHGSNQRRLSQVAYALDVHDARATSETPYAPLMELSYREINERKPVLAEHSLGIYSSLEHQIFTGQLALPIEETHCSYADTQIKALRDDPAARKIIGHVMSDDGQAMSSILIRDSHQRAIGYGIYQIAGLTLPEQLRLPRHWAGFFRMPDDKQIEIIAYNPQQRCQTDVMALHAEQ
ncbi:MAG TPA: hypothetical protein PK031_06265 [Pseudomonadales bacterium]|nr:hypothetical protein [Pseudomonadales bacterium]